jgi:translation initiation factor 3 subunit G
VGEDGRRYKTTRRIKKTVVKTTVNPRVAERKQWAKFGQEKGKAVGPQTDTVSVAENIHFRPVAAWKASNEDKGDEAKKKAELKNAKIKCRICQGDHFTTKCPFKDTMAPEGDVAPADMPDDAPGSAAGGLGAASGGYVPPHLRGRGGAGEKMGGKFDRDDSATLRVTNVSEFAEEQDLRDMFSRYGHVTRVFLAKDRETGRAKGFAFVSYADRTDAAKACEKMDGCKFCEPTKTRLNEVLRRFDSRFRPSYPARRVCEEGLEKRWSTRWWQRTSNGHAYWRSTRGRIACLLSHGSALRSSWVMKNDYRVSRLVASMINGQIFTCILGFIQVLKQTLGSPPNSTTPSVLTSQLPSDLSAHWSTTGHETHRHGLRLLNDIACRSLNDLYMCLWRRLLETERGVAVIADELRIAKMVL